jgi:hypothetical protein
VTPPRPLTVNSWVSRSSTAAVCSTTEHPSGLGAHIATDPTGRTDVPGVWAARNVTDLTAHVGALAAAGAFAAAQINADLVGEEAQDAVESYRGVSWAAS